MRKVLISTCYGGAEYTPEMQKIMQKSTGVRRRVGEVVEYVESVAKECPKPDMVQDMLKDDETILEVVRTDKKCTYCIKCSNEESILYGNIVSFCIVNVDDTRPWTIENYDGYEGVKYLDKRKLEDEELNYWAEI